MEGNNLLESILKGDIDERQFINECMKMKSDDALRLIKDYADATSNGKLSRFYMDLAAKYPELVQQIRDNITIGNNDSQKS